MRLDNPKTFNYKYKRVKRLKLKIYKTKSYYLIGCNLSINYCKNRKLKNCTSISSKNGLLTPKKFSGSVLDGRDITSIILKDAMFKFFITANINTQQKEGLGIQKQNKKISFNEVLKNLKNRDKSDRTRKSDR